MGINEETARGLSDLAKSYGWAPDPVPQTLWDHLYLCSTVCWFGAAKMELYSVKKAEGKIARQTMNMLGGLLQETHPTRTSELKVAAGLKVDERKDWLVSHYPERLAADTFDFKDGAVVAEELGDFGVWLALEAAYAAGGRLTKRSSAYIRYGLWMAAKINGYTIHDELASDRMRAAYGAEADGAARAGVRTGPHTTGAPDVRSLRTPGFLITGISLVREREGEGERIGETITVGKFEAPGVRPDGATAAPSVRDSARTLPRTYGGGAPALHSVMSLEGELEDDGWSEVPEKNENEDGVN